VNRSVVLKSKTGLVILSRRERPTGTTVTLIVNTSDRVGVISPIKLTGRRTRVNSHARSVRLHEIGVQFLFGNGRHVLHEITALELFGSQVGEFCRAIGGSLSVSKKIEFVCSHHVVFEDSETVKQFFG